MDEQSKEEHVLTVCLLLSICVCVLSIRVLHLEKNPQALGALYRLCVCIDLSACGRLLLCANEWGSVVTTFDQNEKILCGERRGDSS